MRIFQGVWREHEDLSFQWKGHEKREKEGAVKMKKCCICGKLINGYGNNPWPVVKKADAECCKKCNNTKVIPARMEMFLSKEVLKK